MKAWAVIHDGNRHVPDTVIYAGDEVEALEQAKRTVRIFGKVCGVEHMPDRDWQAVYHKVDKRLWQEAYRHAPRLKNYQRPDGVFNGEEVLAFVLEQSNVEVRRYIQGAEPTPEAIRTKLRLMAGPHGRTLMVAKLKALGFELL